MALINEHFLKLQKNYLFADIAKKVNAYKAMHPKANVISLGIGDVTQPLCPAVIDAMHKAVDDMAHKETFHGYGPEQGYIWLREAIVKNDFLPRGVHLDPDEIFVNDGAKSDTGNIGELVRWDNSMAVTDPIYPVYIDSNVMIGRAGVFADGKWSNVTYMPCTDKNKFVPQIPDHRVDMIYLCYPNNPTGMVLPKEELRKWVNYAIHNDSIIFYDAAYEAYIQDPDIPHSIYEIRGARKVAIEFHSYSKTAGFTGVRCGYTVVPKELTATTVDGQRLPLNQYWLRRQSTKFNGTSYISQRGAEAIYTPEGKKQVAETIQYYMKNASIMREALTDLGFEVYGGTDAPYLWVKTPGDTPSWQFFEQLLYGAQVVCTPGVGFGPSGEGFVRLTSFGDRDDCIEAMARIKEWLKK
ncbi:MULTISPECIES: LL-diaminopimelate aminotransferase [Prevotella]|jgi:LL-diaminopimelate aminotransferase|uniref:LL-diaminopimelate aminotransferase n=1 Tax=Prevotella lacticifex TaxID=2854755 RepID=A0A9R1CVY0_9BACT|nr:MULTISPECIES: LL-diaminopimelate aminotransferase [Prevotella]MDD6852854.1 LL-diaminopimelate aminotransferase [Prevotella sp.]GJG36993.1 LL-diaminopimelate aminotransferase [Prevotella lacticifex]GJG40507.1 LL-diaminopimelate aminotransferase [Prevotella lacticifex]GJG44204.1 LL-diaminopimelate aminotransferase [Prevotella lacticifex]GJG46889.1 LL-diaminopimelate aminotransferase [Prevotella lacticifex]